MLASLSSSLGIANSGISAISAQLATVSHNVANASTAGYVEETATQTNVTAGGVGLGVRIGLPTRTVDAQLEQDLLSQNATVANLTTQQSTLSPIDTAMGSVGAGDDLSTALGTLQSAFSTLSDDPSSDVQQQAVVTAAQALTGKINTIANAYVTARQGAQDDLSNAVASANGALASIGTLSDQIIADKAAGLGTADLEDQRDQQVATLSQLLGVKTLDQPNGDLLVVTAGGVDLPTRGGAALTMNDAVLGPNASVADGTAPAITVGGVDVTSQLTAGRIGADLGLRDSTLPGYQAQLDEFSYQLSSRFAQQGLTLFSEPDGSVPTGNGTPTQADYVGYAGSITVNPAVVANPAAVRDGTSTVAGSATGASAFTPNPAGGPAGFDTLVTRILDYGFGSDAQDGVPWSAVATGGLGVDGTLSAPYAAPTTLAGFASTLVGSQASQIGAVSTDLTNETTLQTSLTSKVQSVSGVSIDAEMSNMVELQNAYGANAKIITAIQSMFSALLASVN